MKCPDCGAAMRTAGEVQPITSIHMPDGLTCLRNQLTALRSRLEWREVTEINHSTRVLLVAPNGDMWVGSRTKGAMKLGCLWLPLPELPKP